MTVERMIELLEIEHECMLRGSHDDCDRNCEDCELVQDDDDLHVMYTDVIGILKDSRWIPVGERLPESGEHVLVCCEIRCLSGKKKRYVCDGFFAKANTIPGGEGDEYATEYCEEDDEYYLLEGWYEVIRNWEDFSSITISDFVTHWKPLPYLPVDESDEEE